MKGEERVVAHVRGVERVAREHLLELPQRALRRDASFPAGTERVASVGPDDPVAPREARAGDEAIDALEHAWKDLLDGPGDADGHGIGPADSLRLHIELDEVLSRREEIAPVVRRRLAEPGADRREDVHA